MPSSSVSANHGPHAYEPSDLIVALQHLPLVRDRLQRAGVRLAEPTISAGLGLARLRLHDVDEAARQLEREVSKDDKARTWVAQRPRAARGALEKVLVNLRALYAGTYSGWTPSLGKNRLLGRVHGVGEVSHGSAGDPKLTQRKLSPRSSGPGRGVRVGVLDTSFYPQSWLAGSWIARYSDIFDGQSAPPFAQGHATFVTGLVLSQAPGATVEVRTVLKEDGTADSWSVAEAIVDFGRSGIDVLNLSFACYTEDGQPPMVLSAAIDRLDPDLVVVAAAGNHGQVRTKDGGAGAPSDDEARQPAWPAALDDVVAVGAATEGRTRAGFSPDAPWVDMLAPGEKLLSTYLLQARDHAKAVLQFDGYAEWSGTSFAAALVTGAIAAGTDPGRITGRESLLNITTWLDEHAATPSPNGAAARYLPLATP